MNQYINTIFDELAWKYKSSIIRVISLEINDKNDNYDNPAILLSKSQDYVTSSSTRK